MAEAAVVSSERTSDRELNSQLAQSLDSAVDHDADETKANASVRKLAGLDVKAILCGHGEPLVAGAGPALKELAATLQ